MSSKSPTPEPGSEPSDFVASEAGPVRPARPCPNCGKMSVAASYPFCSKRCRMVDLNRWLSGAYAIPGAQAEETDED